jgi:hypothetical protein
MYLLAHYLYREIYRCSDCNSACVRHVFAKVFHCLVSQALTIAHYLARKA